MDGYSPLEKIYFVCVYTLFQYLLHFYDVLYQMYFNLTNRQIEA